MATQINRDELISYISDTSKSLYGFRMRHDFNAMSDAELEDMSDYYEESIEELLVGEMKDALFYQREEERAACKLGVDVDTYKRWMEEADNAYFDDLDAAYIDKAQAESEEIQLREYEEIFS